MVWKTQLLASWKVSYFISAKNSLGVINFGLPKVVLGHLWHDIPQWVWNHPQLNIEDDKFFTTYIWLKTIQFLIFEDDTESWIHRPTRMQRFRNYCDKTFILSKGSYLILRLIFMIYVTISINNMTLINTLYTEDTNIRNTPIYCYFPLYPFLALGGNRFIQYRVMFVGTIISTAIVSFWTFVHYHSNSGITLLFMPLIYVFSLDWLCFNQTFIGRILWFIYHHLLLFSFK